MIDMKRPKPKKSDMENMAMPAMSEGDRYPWGLRITLEKEDLAKLGLKASGFKIGQTVAIQAQAKVTSINSRESTGSDGTYQDVGIQIEKLDLGMKSGKFAGYKNEKDKGPGE